MLVVIVHAFGDCMVRPSAVPVRAVSRPHQPRRSLGHDYNLQSVGGLIGACAVQ